MVIIIDGNHLACRNYYSFDPLITTYGKEVHCIYGFLNSLRLLFKRFKNKNTYFFVTWDFGGKTKRHELDPNYKGDRVSIGGTFKDQVKELRSILNFLNLKQYGQECIEADDFIGTLTFKARRIGQKVLIISGDHDFEQLISKNVTVLSPKSNNQDIFKDIHFVHEMYGLEPFQLIEMMSLTGDSSDNVNGIDGIGPKTAIALLKANGGLINLLNRIDDLKIFNRKGIIVEATETIKNKIKSGIETIKLANELVRIRHDLEIEFRLEHKQNDFNSLKKSFERLEFNRYLQEFEQWTNDFV